MGKLTISMGIFHSYVTNYQRVWKLVGDIIFKNVVGSLWRVSKVLQKSIIINLSQLAVLVTGGFCSPSPAETHRGWTPSNFGQNILDVQKASSWTWACLYGQQRCLTCMVCWSIAGWCFHTLYLIHSWFMSKTQFQEWSKQNWAVIAQHVSSQTPSQ